MQTTVRNVRRIDQGICRATFDLSLPSGATLLGCSLRTKSGERFNVSPPRTPKLDEHGRIERDKVTKQPIWRTIISFADDDVRQQFEDMALAALREQHPALFT